VEVWTAEVEEVAYFRDCQAEGPSEVVAHLEEVPVEVVAHLEEVPVEAVAHLEGVPVEAAVFLVGTVLEGTAVADSAYSLGDLKILQGMEAAPFARLDVANVGREAAAPQASRCTRSSLSQHNCSSLRLEALLSSAQQHVLPQVKARCGPIADTG
jgi:hypothetical protein